VAAFDWYQATVPAPVDDVLEALSDLASGLQVGHERGAHGYGSAACLGSAAEGVVARVWHGGSHDYPHAVLSGEWAQPGAELIRAAFPEHRVSRLDVREDYAEVDAFDRIQTHLVDAARRHRLKVCTAGDHLVTKMGRTVYLGAPSSSVRLRLYDKAAEMRARIAPGDVVRLSAVPECLSRLEAQIRPASSAAKARFASIEPVEALGCAKWMREVWRAVAGLELQPVQVGRGYRQADDERAYRYLLAQYGGVLRRMRNDAGSWECVGLQIGQDLAS
jgi:hypothetical protein